MFSINTVATLITLLLNIYLPPMPKKHPKTPTCYHQLPKLWSYFNRIKFLHPQKLNGSKRLIDFLYGIVFSLGDSHSPCILKRLETLSDFPIVHIVYFKNSDKTSVTIESVKSNHLPGTCPSPLTPQNAVLLCFHVITFNLLIKFA